MLGCKELFDVRTASIVGLLDLNHSENLYKSGQIIVILLKKFSVRTLDVDRAEAGTVSSSHILVQALESICMARSRNSLYMLRDLDWESFLNFEGFKFS